MAKRFLVSVNKVLKALAKNRDIVTGGFVPLNKKQLEKKAGIVGRQTTINVIELLKKQGLLEVENREWRRNRKCQHYALSEKGLYYVANMFPELGEMIRKDLGSKYAEFVEAQERQRIEIMRDSITRLQDVVSGKNAPANSHWLLYMKTDNQGGISGGFTSCTGALPVVLTEEYLIKVEPRPTTLRRFRSSVRRTLNY